MAIVNNPSIASKSKHIGVKFDFFKDLCRTLACDTCVGRKDQYADILTKALWRLKFMVHRTALMNLV